MALLVDDDVDVTVTLLVTRRPASVSVPPAELDYTVNDVCNYNCQIINITRKHAESSDLHRGFSCFILSCL